LYAQLDLQKRHADAARIAQKPFWPFPQGFGKKSSSRHVVFRQALPASRLIDKERS